LTLTKKETTSLYRFLDKESNSSMNKILFLTGMPASGKSYWAEILSAYLKYPFFDLDQQITIQTSSSIPELFARGETYFRLTEQRVLTNLIRLQQQTVIIATGGGTPCFHDNLQIMKRSGKIIFLHTPLHIIVQRILASPHQRPLLKSDDTDPETTIQMLYLKRKSYYLQADLVIDPTQLSAADFSLMIRQQLLQNNGIL